MQLNYSIHGQITIRAHIPGKILTLAHFDGMSITNSPFRGDRGPWPENWKIWGVTNAYDLYQICVKTKKAICLARGGAVAGLGWLIFAECPLQKHDYGNLGRMSLTKSLLSLVWGGCPLQNRYFRPF